MTEAEYRLGQAVAIGLLYGGIDGGHHKQWVIDQMLRILLGDEYDERIADYKSGEDGPETYAWDEGVAP